MPCGDEEFSLPLSCAENRAALQRSIQASSTFEDASSILFSEQHVLPPFHLRALITSIRLEIWQMKQILSTDSSLDNGVWRKKTSTKLERWYACFTQSRTLHETTHSHTSRNLPQLFHDVMAMYYYAQVELFRSFHGLVPHMRNFESLPDETAAKLWEFRGRLARSTELTACMRHCFDCVSSLISLGIHYASRTVPLQCSPDYAPISSLHCIFLCIWLSQEPQTDQEPVGSPEELLITDILNLLRDAGYRPQKHNLAATLAGAWTAIWAQNWVWRG